MTLNTSPKNIAVFSLILLAAASRFIPHPPNFTALGALALFAGTYVSNKRWAVIVPLIAMFISDVIFEITSGTGFHKQLPFVYLSYSLVAVLGFWQRGRVSRPTVMVGSLLSSLLFFFVTNFGVWVTGGYEFSWNGLVTCYVAAIPFFKGTVMGDLFFNFILFAGYALLKWRFPVLAK
jgi:hypothetical protein